MAHTANELTAKIGKTVNVRIEKWVIPMIVKDAKNSYGVPRILVSPTHGKGESWVDVSRVCVDVEV